LGFCVGGGTKAVHRFHTGDAGTSPLVSVPLDVFFCSIIIFDAHYNGRR